jgi:hypothetical protein
MPVTNNSEVRPHHEVPSRFSDSQNVLNHQPSTLNSRIFPEFLRLPKSRERDGIAGLSRSSLNALILPTKANGFKPPVRSIVLRKAGALRGVRLIVVDSLRDYLYANLATQEGN